MLGVVGESFLPYKEFYFLEIHTPPRVDFIRDFDLSILYSPYNASRGEFL